MVNSWFRFYNDVVNDLKVQSLSGDDFKAWVNILCVTSKHDGALPSDLKTVAFLLRETVDETEETLSKLCDLGLLDKDESGYHPHNWDGRQFRVRTSTERVRRFRKRKKENNETLETVSETPPDSDSDSETDINKKKKNGKVYKGTRISQDWIPSVNDIQHAVDKGYSQQKIDSLAEAFKDHWKSASGQKATKMDWEATWRTWVRNDIKFNGEPEKTGDSLF